HSLRERGLAVRAHAQGTTMFFQPIVRKALHHVFGIERPGVWGGGVQEASLAFRITKVISKLTRGEDSLSRFGAEALAYAIILLTTFAAEDEGQEDTATVTRHVLLFVHREIPLCLCL